MYLCMWVGKNFIFVHPLMKLNISFKSKHRLQKTSVLLAEHVTLSPTEITDTSKEVTFLQASQIHSSLH